MWTAARRRALRRAGTLVVSCLAGLHLASGAVEARSRQGHPQAPVPALQGEVADTPRFFTIAQVLARRDGRAAAVRPLPAGAVRVASLDTADFPAMRGTDIPFAERGFRLFGASAGQVRARWLHLQAEWETEKARVDRCMNEGHGCAGAVGRFLEMRAAVQSLTGTEQLSAVNALVNGSVRYMSDAARHGLPDVWSPPLKTLGNVGDCEDYAIAKYFMLASAGRPVADMRIVLLRDRRAGEDHAVLAVREEGRWHLLDNRWNRLDTDRSTPHYRPVFALNEASVDLFAAPYSERNSADPDEIATASAWGQALGEGRPDESLIGELLHSLMQ